MHYTLQKTMLDTYGFASGNKPDIECFYGEYNVSVEVTMQQGKRQYESEGEPVARHYGEFKKANSPKDAYCLFIAPKINQSSSAHFFGLNHINISLYGGKSKIIPLELDQFMQLVENAYSYKEKPSPSDFRSFLDSVIYDCEKATDENIWKDAIQNKVESWLVFN